MSEHKEAGILRLLAKDRPEIVPVLWDTMLSILHETGYQPYRALREDNHLITGLVHPGLGAILPMFEETLESGKDYAAEVMDLYAAENKESSNG